MFIFQVRLRKARNIRQKIKNDCWKENKWHSVWDRNEQPRHNKPSARTCSPRTFCWHIHVSFMRWILRTEHSRQLQDSFLPISIYSYLKYLVKMCKKNALIRNWDVNVYLSKYVPAYAVQNQEVYWHENRPVLTLYHIKFIAPVHRKTNGF